MKNKYKIVLALCLIATFTISCKKWINVEPKSQIENERFFSDAQGYVEALNGVYIKMGTPALYGKELTFGFTDAIGSMYILSSTAGSQDYRDSFAGLYQNGGSYGIVTNIWNNAYNAIANLNNILEQLESADQSMFASGQYNIIKGEALGLRAYLHFDVLRLFTKSYKDGGVTTPGIPYVTQYKPIVTPRLTVKDAMDKILADLKTSEILLKADPVFTTTGVAADERRQRLNYYAVKAVKARAYLWANDNVNALKDAEDVIAVAPVKFPFVLQSAVATSNEAIRDRVFVTEHLFGLYVSKVAQNYVALLDTSKFNSALQITAARITEQFETASVGSTDYRNVYLIRNLSTLSPARIFFGKLYQPAGITAALQNRMPLIKIPEMYYIAAECLKDTDPTKAIDYLNKVRQNRGISTLLSSSLNASQIQDEIRKEYWKEMPLEGQMFFYYKRTSSTTVPAVSGTYPSSRYILPLPPLELQFGN